MGKFLGYDMANYQLYHQGRPVDEERLGKKMLLKDYTIKCGSTLLMTIKGVVLEVKAAKVS